ncbi:unnamed protein product [Withania somnifera]
MCSLLDKKLPMFTIYRNFEAYYKYDIGDHQVELPSDVTFNHLTEVRLRLPSGSIIEMQLAKLLLVKSPMLVRMLFTSSAKGLVAVKKLAAELTTYQHASPKVEVVFIDN